MRLKVEVKSPLSALWMLIRNTMSATYRICMPKLKVIDSIAKIDVRAYVNALFTTPL